MRARRGSIEPSLAQRGRAAMWANEQEAAILSGVGMDRFRLKIKEWEARGFPQINLENGKRSIPRILTFWGLPSDHSEVLSALVTEEEDGEENWDGRQGQRQVS
jgi:hypothetical protein